ncbi:aromatic-ring hydroxylase C-terminal domain-containing protein [Kitasatospora sp. NPDC054768]
MESSQWVRPAAAGARVCGAVLVRPDGHIAWRARQAPAEDGRLLAVLRRAPSAPDNGTSEWRSSDGPS